MFGNPELTRTSADEGRWVDASPDRIDQVSSGLPPARTRTSDKMDASSMIADWKRRLVAMAANPPYVFRDTPQHLIDEHFRRLTTFCGWPASAVAQAEERLRVRFPSVFRTFLLEMGKSPGDLFADSDLAGLDDLEQFRTKALRLLSETDPLLTLAPEAVVFLSYQGCGFVYQLAVGGFDGPPMSWAEAEREPQQTAPTFAQMVDADLQLMESNVLRFRELGGFYLTLHPGGGVTQLFPSLTSGERPLDSAKSITS
jgi:hypothetical protein